MKKITRKNLRPLLEKYASNVSALEIGGGENSSNYSDLFPNCHTLDVDPERGPMTVGDAHNLPFSDNSYDLILCTEVLEHLHSPHQAISEMRRVLKPGGRLILTTRFIFPIHDAPGDYYRYTKYGLQHLLSDWQIESLDAETRTFSALGALFQRIGFQSDLRGGKISKFLVYAFAMLLDKLNWIIKNEFGDIKKSRIEDNILTTGYFLTAIKK